MKGRRQQGIRRQSADYIEWKDGGGGGGRGGGGKGLR